MTNQNRINLQFAALVLSVVMGASSLLGVAYSLMSYPYRIDTLERVTIPEIKAVQQELRREMATDRANAAASRELLLRIDERLAAVQRKLEERHP